MICFFKQKTAYEMRISDWSSDVCSSDLQRILQDTADKIEPTVAAYDPDTGFSSPTAEPPPMPLNSATICGMSVIATFLPQNQVKAMPMMAAATIRSSEERRVG